MSREKLQEAKSLIQEKRFDEARAILRSMPDDPTAQNWLAKLNEKVPEKMPTPEKTSRRLPVVGIIAGAAILLVLILLGILALSNNKDPESYTEADLKRALLTLDDMPSGWSARPEEDDEEDDEESNSFLCGSELDIDTDALVSANAQFAGGELAPLVLQGVAVFPEGEAKKLFEEFTNALETCKERQDEDEMTWHIAKMSFPEFGNDSAAFRISTSDIPLVGVFEMQLVITQSGDFLNVVMHADIGMDGVDTDQTEKFARRADEKLRDVIG
jgi:hypothetical protein